MLNKYSLEKIKTIGDNYMLAGGIPQPTQNHAISVTEMALDMLEVIPRINKETNQYLAKSKRAKTEKAKICSKLETAQVGQFLLFQR